MGYSYGNLATNRNSTYRGLSTMNLGGKPLVWRVRKSTGTYNYQPEGPSRAVKAQFHRQENG
jgi:hypothetical protein